MTDAPTSRSVPEWIGATPDTRVPTRVRVRVFERFQGRCYLSGRKIMPGDKWELEHVKALILGGENRENNLAPVLPAAHREKTKADVSTKAKTDRIRAKHLGVWQGSGRRLQSRNTFAERPFPRDNRRGG